MTYENAPSTRMLAVKCASCHKPLRDALSVNVGMGPECRKRIIFQDASETNRKAANRLVAQIAVEADMMNVAKMIQCLQNLGFGELADVIARRKLQVVIKVAQGRIELRTPREGVLRPDMELQCLNGCRWNSQAGVYTIPYHHKHAVYAILKKYWTGEVAIGPKGPFTVGQ